MLDNVQEYFDSIAHDYRKKIAYRLLDRLYWKGQARGSYIPIGLFGFVSQMSKKNARCLTTGRFLK
tara:strand:- start:37 stop:234 length:198 start_codon:yes stop_codon:yes gene_type:complete